MDGLTGIRPNAPIHRPALGHVWSHLQEFGKKSKANGQENAPANPWIWRKRQEKAAFASLTNKYRILVNH